MVVVPGARLEGKGGPLRLNPERRDPGGTFAASLASKKAAAGARAIARAEQGEDSEQQGEDSEQEEGEEGGE